MAALGSSAAIEVDGGLDADDRRRRWPTPGASLFVAGSAIFGKPDPAAAYAEIAAAVGAS